MATSPPIQRLLDWLAQVKSEPVTFSKVFIRWIRDSQTSFDSDPAVVDLSNPEGHQALLDQAVKQMHAEAELRVQAGSYPFGVTHYEVVVETVVQVSQFKVAINRGGT